MVSTSKVHIRILDNEMGKFSRLTTTGWTGPSLSIAILQGKTFVFVFVFFVLILILVILLQWNSVITNTAVNEHSLITDRFSGQMGHFSTLINPVIKKKNDPELYVITEFDCIIQSLKFAVWCVFQPFYGSRHQICLKKWRHLLAAKNFKSWHYISKILLTGL